MEEIDEKVQEVKSLLTNRSPIFFFESSAPEFVEFKIKFEGYSGLDSFENNFGKKLDDLIFNINKNAIINKVTKKYIKSLIEELSISVKSYDLKNIKNKIFFFQPNATINFYDGLNHYKKIEETEDEYFQQIIRISQQKHSFTIKLINELNKILDNHVAEENSTIDYFFDKLIDHDPCFSKDLKDIYVSSVNTEVPFLILMYKGFDSSKEYYWGMFENAKNIILQFKNERTSNTISNERLEYYIDALKLEVKSLVKKNLNEKEFLCHPTAYLTDYYKHMYDAKYDIQELNGSSLADEFIAYNKYRMEILLYLINEMKSIIKKKDLKEENSKVSNLTNEFSKLEMNLSVSDIALLFRLLDEEKLLKYKHRTEIYQYISSTIKSSNQENISPKSLKNLFLSPNNSSIEKFKFLLSNLKQKLTKIQ
jgi:hypothetical protein